MSLQNDHPILITKALLSYHPQPRPNQIQGVAEIKAEKEYLLCNIAKTQIRIKAMSDAEKRDKKWVVKVILANKPDATVFEISLADWGICAYSDGRWNGNCWMEQGVI